MSLAITAKLDNIDEVLNLILTAAIDEHRVAETGSLFIFDEGTQKLRLVRKTGEQSFIQFTEFSIGEGIAGYAAATRATQLVNQCSADFHYKPFTAVQSQLQCILATPILTPGERKLLGVLCIHNSDEQRAFSEADKVFVEGLAQIAGVAWSNASTHQRVVTASQYDTFTRLLSRDAIEAVLAEFVGKARLSGQPLSVLYIDLDNLKELNDTLSTDVGDMGILAVARAIEEATFANYRDKAGKWKEGDEFVVVLPGAPKEQACVVAERIRRKVEQHQIDGVGQPLPHITVSIGVAQLSVKDESGHALALRAEQAKLRAKAQGKNCVCVDDQEGSK